MDLASSKEKKHTPRQPFPYLVWRRLATALYDWFNSHLWIPSFGVAAVFFYSDVKSSSGV